METLAERNTTQELWTRSLVFWSVSIFFTFKLTQTYTYKRTKLTYTSCTFAYNLKVKEPKRDVVVNSPLRGYTSVEVSLSPCHAPCKCFLKTLTVPCMVQTHTTNTYPLRVRSFLFQLNGTFYLFHFLVPTTNVPNGPMQLVGHL